MEWPTTSGWVPSAAVAIRCMSPLITGAIGLPAPVIASAGRGA
jgi:hypothetical protein